MFKRELGDGEPSPPQTRNSEVLADFAEYCADHPAHRFWQALRNWSGYHFVFVADANPDLTHTPPIDTFNFEGKRIESGAAQEISPPSPEIIGNQDWMKLAIGQWFFVDSPSCTYRYSVQERTDSGYTVICDSPWHTESAKRNMQEIAESHNRGDARELKAALRRIIEVRNERDKVLMIAETALLAIEGL